MQHIPDDLNGRAFTIAEAADRGLSRRSLDGRRFVRIHRGVYRTAATAPTLPLMLDAAQLVLPADVAISHLTALRVFGLDVGPELPLHFSTNRRVQIDRDDVVVHRRQDRLFVEQWSGRRSCRRCAPSSTSPRCWESASCCRWGTGWFSTATRGPRS